MHVDTLPRIFYPEPKRTHKDIYPVCIEKLIAVALDKKKTGLERSAAKVALVVLAVFLTVLTVGFSIPYVLRVYEHYQKKSARLTADFFPSPSFKPSDPWSAFRKPGTPQNGSLTPSHEMRPLKL